jgi:hypothetical protein
MEISMKNKKLFMLVVLVLVSCAAPVTPAPTQTFTQEPTSSTSIFFDSSTAAPIPVTINPAMGTIEGNISWLDPKKLTKIPISHVNLEINGHSSGNPRYTTKTDPKGHYAFVNIEAVKYGIGVYLNLPISERRCEAPEYLYSEDLGWLHYATALRGDIWYDILFSTKDVMVNPGWIVVVDFVLKCP